MKKSIFIVAAITAFALSSTSCKKPRTCSCTYTAAAGATYSGLSSGTYTIVDTKKKAQASCEALAEPTYETCTLN